MKASILALTLCTLPGLAMAAPVAPVKAQLESLAKETKLPYSELSKAVESASLNPKVIDAMNHPWESKPWYQYSKIFLTDKRVRLGVDFWKAHAATLKRAEQEYQVPANLIVAILGVETYYGERMGDIPVLDALYTLGFHYPKRSAFFSKEFADYVKLSSEEKWPLTSMKGSYAGAMGMGQFIPSSYLHYAVDFSGDGQRDLFNNPDDAIGSVANYFHQHDWQYSQPVAYPAHVTSDKADALLSPKLKPELSWKQLAKDGVSVDAKIPADAQVKLLKLKGKKSPDYWVVLDNFYVITRYNHSPLYAMAVYQLSEQIAREYHATS
ncbi:lytic murein transglycosylase B [Dongshaea marina]|uniref:lytic murein transglycosylase B n=1 Tax=Dongshaea marina TaxID=2047966 RepID=UPI000D3E890D|nr:lytic murein transglycosylase B [Dongshaea marina]